MRKENKELSEADIFDLMNPYGPVFTARVVEQDFDIQTDSRRARQYEMGDRLKYGLPFDNDPKVESWFRLLDR